MLAARAEEQRSRVPGFTPMHGRPAGHIGDWSPFGKRVPLRVMHAQNRARAAAIKKLGALLHGRA